MHLVRMVGGSISWKALNFFLSFLYKQVVLNLFSLSIIISMIFTWSFLGLCTILENLFFDLIKHNDMQEGDAVC